MDYYKELVRLNNEHKLFYKEYIKDFTEDKKEYTSWISKWKFIDTDGTLYLYRPYARQKRPIEQIGALFKFYEENGFAYITNISFILKYKHVLTKYLLSTSDWVRIHYYLMYSCVYKSFNLIKVEDIDSFIARGSLINKMQVKLNHSCYKVIETMNKKIYLVSELNLVINEDTQFSFNNMDNVENIKITNLEIADSNLGELCSLQNMFRDCTRLKSIIFENFNTSKIKDFGYMFKGCFRLQYIDISCFDTSSALRFDYMFCECSSLRVLDLNHFKIDNVRSLEAMFDNCMTLETLKIETWNVDKLPLSKINLHVDFSFMFRNTINLKNLYVEQFRKAIKPYYANTEKMFDGSYYEDWFVDIKGNN